MSEGRPVWFAPSDDAPVTNDWSKECAQMDGATLTASSWSIAPAGPVLHDDSRSGAKATVFVSGCTAGTDYLLANTATFSNGAVLSRNRALKCAADF